MNRTVSIVWLLLIATNAFCHDSPSHKIEELTKKLDEDSKESMSLLLERAYEWQAIGHWEESANDFALVLEESPELPEAILGLGKVKLRQGHAQEAANLAKHGYSLNLDHAMSAQFRALRAQALTTIGLWEGAKDEWEIALFSPRPQIDWYLQNDRVLYHLERYSERVAVLERALQKNKSIVLEKAWIEALIDDDKAELALNQIEIRMHSARLKSSWLLLRAQAFKKLELSDKQHADAGKAYEEIRSRLSPTRPDVQLLIEASKALAFHERFDEAESYRLEARQRGASEAALVSLDKFF